MDINIYGCLLLHNSIYFVNNNCGVIDKKGGGKEIINDILIKNIKDAIMQRYVLISNNIISIDNIDLTPKLKIISKRSLNLSNNSLSKKKRLTGGTLEDINKLFIIPNNIDCDVDYNEFKKNLININRGYLSSTREANDVKAIFLYFLNIDDFDVSNYDKNISNKKAFIITEQEVYDEKEINKNIELLKNKENEKPVFYPVYVDAEYNYKSHDNLLSRQLYLSDGNHRIIALKKYGYRGYIPTIICDYLPYVI